MKSKLVLCAAMVMMSFCSLALRADTTEHGAKGPSDQEKYTLTLKVKPGEVLVYDYSLDMKAGSSAPKGFPPSFQFAGVAQRTIFAPDMYDDTKHATMEIMSALIVTKQVPKEEGGKETESKPEKPAKSGSISIAVVDRAARVLKLPGRRGVWGPGIDLTYGSMLTRLPSDPVVNGQRWEYKDQRVRSTSLTTTLVGMESVDDRDCMVLDTTPSVISADGVPELHEKVWFDPVQGIPLKIELVLTSKDLGTWSISQQLSKRIQLSPELMAERYRQLLLVRCILQELDDSSQVVKGPTADRIAAARQLTAVFERLYAGSEIAEAVALFDKDYVQLPAPSKSGAAQ